MKLSIQRETLLPAIERTIGVVEAKSTSPVLSNLLFIATEQGLQITGTDLDTEITAYLDNTGIETFGSITVSARKILDICKALPVDSVIKISVVKNTLTLRSGSSQFSLATLPADGFPVLDSIPFDNVFSIPENKLSHLVAQTSYAMGVHDVRYFLNGMLLQMADDKITTVATDGHRLACCTLSFSLASDPANDVGVIIPRKGVHEISRLLRSDCETDIKLELSNNHIRLSKDNVRFTSKLIEGKYPDYNGVIPNSTLHTIELDRTEIKASLMRVAILSNEKFRGVMFKLSDGLLILRSNNPDRETAEESIKVNSDAEDFEVSFNINYLLDAINNLSGNNISISLNHSKLSSLILCKEDAQTINVVMPVKL